VIMGFATNPTTGKSQRTLSAGVGLNAKGAWIHYRAHGVGMPNVGPHYMLAHMRRRRWASWQARADGHAIRPCFCFNTPKGVSVSMPLPEDARW